MPLTLEEIAHQAGVSRSTVSRVLNDQPNVSARARERVLAVTERLNFQPNAMARSLAGGRARIIGLLIPVGVPSLFTDPFFPLLTQGIAAACNQHDYTVALWLADVEHEHRMAGKIIHGGLVDGVIVASTLMDDPVIPRLVESGVPLVLVGRHPSDERVSYVDVDNYSGSKEMVEYLLQLGYRRIATVSGLSAAVSGHDRLEGYCAALRAWGIAPDPSLIAQGDFSEDSGYAAIQQLLALGDSPRLADPAVAPPGGADQQQGLPDAVFAASDSMALGVLRALREAGIRGPEEMAVASFDDMPFAARAVPPLTTVRQPIQRIGAVAAEMLFDLIENPDTPPRRTILATELVIRASSGAGVGAAEGPHPSPCATASPCRATTRIVPMPVA
jgi:LacI family transcriptional regulator